MKAARVVLVLTALGVSFGQFALATYSATIFLHGDFAQTVPEDFSVFIDDRNSLETFFRGPSQYLTVMPLAVLGSYETVARALLPIYAVLIGAIAWVSWYVPAAVLKTPVPPWPVIAATVGFPPLLEAYLGREFEVVTTAAFAVMTWAIVRGRFSTGGALAAYIALYKYVPFVLLPYFLVRRWWRAAFGFIAVAAAILAVAYAVFGLDRFANNNVPAKAAGLITGMTSTHVFCNQLGMKGDEREADDTSLRADACRISGLTSIPAPLLYGGALAGLFGAVAVPALRIRRRAQALARHDEQWRRIVELGLLAVFIAAFVYTHYYYLALLLVPLNALLVRFLSDASRHRGRLVLWLVAYVLLGALLLPPQLTERWIGINPYVVAVGFFGPLLGQLLLTGLLLREYLGLAAAPATD